MGAASYFGGGTINGEVELYFELLRGLDEAIEDHLRRHANAEGNFEIEYAGKTVFTPLCRDGDITRDIRIAKKTMHNGSFIGHVDAVILIDGVPVCEILGIFVKFEKECG